MVEKLDRASARSAAELRFTNTRYQPVGDRRAQLGAIMIEKLNRGLTVEFALVPIFIGLAFRSVA